MLRELAVPEQRYRAVLDALDGAAVTEVARRYGVSRQSVHGRLARYAAVGGVVNLHDRSSRPHSCPHQMSPAVEAKVLAIRDRNPRWGPDRIVYQLGREGVVPVPGRTSVYRALVRNGRIHPAPQRLQAVGAWSADGAVADGRGRWHPPRRWGGGQGVDRDR